MTWSALARASHDRARHAETKKASKCRECEAVRKRKLRTLRKLARGGLVESSPLGVQMTPKGEKRVETLLEKMSLEDGMLLVLYVADLAPAKKVPVDPGIA